MKKETIASNLQKEMKNADWRTRYKLLKTTDFTDLASLMSIKQMLINIAHFDPCHIVRTTAVALCNKLHLTYKGKPIRLRKMRSLHNTLKAKHINIQKLMLQCVMTNNINPKQTLSDDDYNNIYTSLKQIAPKVYDLLDGHFATPDTYENRKSKNKVQQTIQNTKNKRLDQYIYNVIRTIPNDKIKGIGN